MEFTKLIEERRSIRAYKEGTVITKEEIEELLLAVQNAPSWANTATGRYYVVTDPEKKEKLRTEMLFPGNAKNSANCAAYFVTAFEKGRAGFREGQALNELGDEWGAYDLGLQASYLVLKAKDMGYDTLIMGIREADKLRAEFGIPENEEIAAVIALGVRDAEPRQPVHKPLDEIAKFF